ncbi:hypothetical protein HDV57DRAFT_504855 [Trichoderma longibrachiatum]|uniref:Uncharacterized protein n=1 Tax=Trichoderma longibrachiatum ATCC 18648 TaxID=983965 RepID=A0A2T4C9N5_TRILO|nr:hypothetical protein M440DRAFT_17845 [Trichoderma longibrachiatum ATCC 18648]
MNQVPSTPTPRRFLLPGRSTQSSSQTPGGPPRFQSTPRFGSSSAAKSTQKRELDIEESDNEEEQDDEVVYESSLSGDERAITQMRQAGSRQRVLEIESDAGIASQEDVFPENGDGRMRAPLRFDIEESFDAEMEREAKRRKTSVSPSPLLGSLDTMGAEENTPAHFHEETDADIDDGSSGMSRSSSEEGSPITMRSNSKAPRQPIFQQAPRFKPLDTEDTLSGGLPAAFSPQRRGAKYVPGGMAAQLQGWLSEVRMWDESGGDKAESVLRLHVEQVRPGRRMYLVQGRVASEETSKRWILAGEGRLTGLGRRAEVKEGSVVVVGQPVWDVEVEGGLWNVACEWSVEGG